MHVINPASAIETGSEKKLNSHIETSIQLQLHLSFQYCINKTKNYIPYTLYPQAYYYYNYLYCMY